LTTGDTDGGDADIAAGARPNEPARHWTTNRRPTMTTIIHRMLGASASALVFAVSLAAAQTPETLRVRGTIESVDGPIFNVKMRDGAMLKLKLAENAPVRTVVKASLGDIKVGSYLAITSVAQPDGSQKALAVLIFPEAQRGVAEGSMPWDFVPNSRMTNATVESTVASVDGQVLIVKYKDSDQKIVVPPNAEIITYAAATAADLKSGKKIFVFTAKKLSDGTVEAPNVSFGDYGVWR